MKLTMIAVMSINGIITSGDGRSERDWASAEDGQYFQKMLAEHSVIIMGRKTYDVVKPKPAKGKLRVVLTHSPQLKQEAQVAEQLEFTDQSPQALVSMLADRSYKNALLVGGSEIYALFLNAGLVNELHLTIEPMLIPSGISIVSNVRNINRFKIISSERLNQAGTLLLRYACHEID